MGQSETCSDVDVIHADIVDKVKKDFPSNQLINTLSDFFKTAALYYSQRSGKRPERCNVQKTCMHFSYFRHNPLLVSVLKSGEAGYIIGGINYV